MSNVFHGPSREVRFQVYLILGQFFRVRRIPEKLDGEIARLKLKAIQIDRLTPEQKKYLSSWETGT